MRLLESSHAPRRGRAGTLASVAIHVAVIGGALVATAHAHDALVDDGPPERTIYYAPPPPADAAPRHAPTTRDATSPTGGPTAPVPPRKPAAS